MNEQISAFAKGVHQSEGKTEAGKGRCGNGKKTYAVCREWSQNLSGKGQNALMQAVTAMRIPAALEDLKNGIHRSAEVMRESAGRIDAISIRQPVAGTFPSF